MKQLEEYHHRDSGYNPFLIRKGWQVAKLNHLPLHGFTDMIDVEVHHKTDEAFILLKGSAVLVIAERVNDGWKFEVVSMKEGVVYNIPAGVWHNIGMDRNSEVIIVENDNTHINDGEHFPLNEAERVVMTKMVLEAI